MQLNKAMAGHDEAYRKEWRQAGDHIDVGDAQFTRMSFHQRIIAG